MKYLLIDRQKIVGKEIFRKTDRLIFRQIK